MLPVGTAQSNHGAQQNKRLAVEQLNQTDTQTLFHSNRSHDLVHQYSFDDDLVQTQTVHL